MGCPGCAARGHFVRWGGKKANSAHYFSRCKRCLAAHYLRAAARKLQNPDLEEPRSPLSPAMVGRQENFEKHLRNAHGILDPANVPAPPTPKEDGPFNFPQHHTPPPAMQFRQQRRSDQGVGNLPAQAAPFATSFAASDSSGVYRRNYSPAQRREFERFLLEFQVALALPDSFVEHPTTKRLFYFLNPQCLGSIPSRRVMGGRILNEYAEEHAQQKNMELIKGQEESGGRVNFLSDVWQNISKNHLLGAHLVLFGIVVVEGLHAVGSEHHGIALARQMEAVLVRLVHQGWNVGAVLTDNAGQCERARRILAGRWPSIHFGKCFAHDINNLVKAILKRTSFRLVADQACAAVNALNGSSSKWLPRAEKVIMETYELNKPLAFLSLCYTRWNSMQGCFASLLRVKTGLKQFATRFRYYSDLPSDVLVFNDETFWTTLEDAEQIIRPLCNASYILQRDENTLVDVVLCFRGIFDGFVAGPHARELIPLVEERWNDCEQPLFILALFLHPRYREAAKALPNEGISSIDSVCNYAVFYFKRFFRRDPGMLRDHMDRWCSDTLYVGYEKLVYGEFETAWRFWSAAKRMKAGPNLPDLAIAVLSIAANTATCERYFSQLGRIHTPVRNCLKAEKTNEAAITGQAIRECDHQEAKTLEREKDQDSDENEVVEEDSDGNKYLKYAGRIVKAEERQYRGDISTSNPAPDQVSINGVLIRPIASAREFQRYPDYRPSTPSRPPGTPRRHSPTPSRPPVTPSRSHSMSRPIPATPSRPYSKMPQVVPEDQESARKLCSSLKGYHQLFYLAQLHQPAPAREIPVLISDSHAAMGRHLLTVPPPSSACSCLKTPMCESELDRLEREGGGESRPVNDFESSHETDVSTDEADEEVIDEENLRLQPIPDYNDTSFPQEPGKLPGLRGAKSKLVELFSLPTRL